MRESVGEGELPCCGMARALGGVSMWDKLWYNGSKKT